MQHTLLELPRVGYEVNRPDPSGTADVFRRIGYALDEALADLIDNSIDADAQNILIRFIRRAGQIQRIVIADDGHGMTEAELRRSMRYGVKAGHSREDLGKYGIGMKSASFSQCKSLSVVTKHNSVACGRRWTLASIDKDWRQEVIDPKRAAALLQESWGDLDISESGTLIVWDDLDVLSKTGTTNDTETAIANTIKAIIPALGLRFHRFLNSGLRIVVDALNLDAGTELIPVGVTPLDPFGYPSTGHRGYPVTFKLDVDRNPLQLIAHIWPPKTKNSNYKLGGGSVSARQGFYFYRNDRLIQAGGWNGIQNDSEPHYSLARVRVDLPSELDSEFRLSVQKHKLDPPPGFFTALAHARVGKTTFRDYLAAANEVYRSAKETVAIDNPGVRAGKGLPAVVAKRINGKTDDNRRAIDFVWMSLPDDRFFEFDRESERIILNQHYRKVIIGTKRGSVADAPIIKSLLFLLLRDQLVRQRSSKKAEAWLSECNSILLAAIRAQHG